MFDLNIPRICKHFKGRYYGVIGVSKPFLDLEELPVNELHDVKTMKVHHTETGEVITIYLDPNNEKLAYHDKKYEEGRLMIYKSLYMDNNCKAEAFARPKDMFFSKVDKVKYPNVKQKYRMKFLHYIEDDDVTEL